jgi:hypothetical protein
MYWLNQIIGKNLRYSRGGAVITQGNEPIAFFSRKLTETQQCYSVTKIELLTIVEALKEFKGMLWGTRNRSSPTIKP